MKYIAVLFLLFIVVSSTLAQDQISIDFPDFIMLMKEKNSIQNFTTPFSAVNPAALSAIVGKGDTDQVWDFTVANYIRQPQAGIDTILVYSNSIGTALANDPDFTSAFEVIATLTPNAPTRYNYLRLGTDTIKNLGISEDSLGIASKLISWNPPLLEEVLPIRYQNTWHSISNVGEETIKPGEKRVITQHATVDGWGKIKLPTFPEVPALRVKKQIITLDSINENIVTIDTSYRYDFNANNLVNATIITDSKNVIQSAEYSGSFVATASVQSDESNGYNFTITDNPVTASGTKIIYSVKHDGPVLVEVMDELGNIIRMLQQSNVTAGQHTLTIDPGMIGAGVYFIRLISPEMTIMKKLVIVR